MKHALWFTVLIIFVLSASTAFAQNGTICLYADPAGTQCSISDTGPGVLSVYVIHNSPNGTIGATFAAPKPDCMVGVTWITDSTPFSLYGGNSQTGASLAYGGCVTGPTHVATIQYMASGLSQLDCPYSVVPAAGHGFIEDIVCTSSMFSGTGGLTYVNSTLPCQCSEPTGPPELFVHPSSLDFSEPLYSVLPLTIENVGGGTLAWSVSWDQTWLSVNPVQGVNDAVVYVRVNRSGLPAGTYTGNVNVSGGGESIVVPATMVVPSVPQSPQLQVSADALTFTSTSTPETFQIWNSGGGTLQWSLSADQQWISITPPLSGSGSKWVSVEVAPPGPSGPEDGHITVSSNGGTASVLIHYEPALSVGGAVGIFANLEATDCNLFDQAPGVMTFYIVHVLTAGALAAQFAAPMPSCMTGAAYLGETSPFNIVLGNTQTGVTVAYGRCLGGPIHLLTVFYLVQGMSQACCEFPVVADPRVPSGQIEVPSCGFVLNYGAGAHAIVNPTPTCACGSVPVEETTWGHIKAMYAPDEDR